MAELEVKKTRVALYIRVSTDKQVKEGESLEAQEDVLTKYAKEHKYKIVDKYIEYGESGQKLSRTALTRLLEDVKQDKIDLIIFTKLDRWFRNVRDFYKVQEVLSAHNVNWKTILESNDTTTSSGTFMLNLMLSLGQLEAQRDSERINVTFDYKYHVQKTVCSGAKKFGWDIVDKRYVINEEEAEKIRLSFQHFVEVQSLAEHIRWYQKNIRLVSAKTIKKELRDISVIGKFKTAKGEILDDFIPAIISEELFYEVQRILDNNVKVYKTNNNERRIYIFSGLVRCSECGGKFCGTTNKAKYYRCLKTRHNDAFKCSNGNNLNEKEIENFLLQNIKSIIDENILKINSQKEKKEKKTSNLPIIKSKMNKLSSMYLDDLVDEEYYKKHFQLLKEEADQLEKEEREIKTDTKKLESFKDLDFYSLYRKLDDQRKLKFWRDIIKEIRIDKERNIFVELNVD